MPIPNHPEALHFLEEAEEALDQADACMENEITVRTHRFPAIHENARDLRNHVAGLIQMLKYLMEESEETVSTDASTPVSDGPTWKDCTRCGNPLKRGACPVCQAPESVNWPEVK